MTQSQRKATARDLPEIIALLADDELGQKRENANTSGALDQRYIDASSVQNAIKASCFNGKRPLFKKKSPSFLTFIFIY